MREQPAGDRRGRGCHQRVGARTVRVPVRMLEHYHFRLRRPEDAEGAGQGERQARRRARRSRTASAARARKARAGRTRAKCSCCWSSRSTTSSTGSGRKCSCPNLQGARRPLRRDGLDARRLGQVAAPARGSTAAAPSRRWSSAAAIRTPRRPSPTTTCASASSRAASSPRCMRSCSSCWTFRAACPTGIASSRSRFFFWVVQGLRREYRSLETVFVAHTTEAWEFTEPEFFQVSGTGGTVASTGLQQGARDHRRALQPGPLQHLSVLRVRRRQLGERWRRWRASRCKSGRRGRVLHGLCRSVIGAVAAARHGDRAGCTRSSHASGMCRRQLRAERLRRRLGRRAPLLHRARARRSRATP